MKCSKCPLIVATMSLLVLFSAHADIVVNSTGDKPNAFPLMTGVCSTDIIDSGECTLRAAIQLANFNANVTTITFNIPTSDPGYDAQAGSYTINVGSSTGSPLPELSTDVSITGPGANVLTVQRDPNVVTLGIFSITTASTVNIAGIRIKDGSLPGGSGAGIANFNDAIVNVNSCVFLGNTANGRGGGFANYSTGNVTLTNCVFTQNAADQGGGGVANLSNGKVTVTDCTIEANTGAHIGGGVFNSNGIFSINHTGISTNVTGGAGGGVYNMFGTVNLSDSTLSQNNANGGEGGGVFNREGSLVIDNSRISSNTCTSPPSSFGSGGGVHSAAGSLTITNCTVSDNSLMGGNNTGSGAGTALGGGIFANGSLTLRGTTVANNTATGGSATSLFGAPGSATGGGLFSAAESLVTNCTFSGNSARPGASRILERTADGGGIYFDSTGHNFTLNNSTVTGNSAVSMTVIGQDTANSGGLVNKSGNFIVKSSLVASNSGGSAPDVSGTFVSQGYNLIGVVDGSSGFNMSTDHTGMATAPLDPKIDPAGLKNNGGPTQTIALLSTSIAINNGAPDSPPTDQRGVARVHAPDIGAFEFTGFMHYLGNISTRGFVGTGDNLLIGGLIVTGVGPKQVVLRALGPTLGQPPFSVSGALSDPVLELHAADGHTVTSNDNWMDASNAAAVMNSGLAPPNPSEAAILTNLDPGNYTAIVRGAGDSTGISLVEGYDLDPQATSQFGNISTRGFVQTGDNVMIAGVIVKGTDSQNVIVRGLGPTLAQPPFSVPNTLADPFLDLRDANGNPIVTNDNWQDTQSAQIQASGYAPPNLSESAILITLPPGNYTAILSGVNNTTGNALVEVYALN